MTQSWKPGDPMPKPPPPPFAFGAVPPFGVRGCRCWLEGRDGPGDWTANASCPYHGLVQRHRNDTGTYRVIPIGTKKISEPGRPVSQEGIDDAPGPCERHPGASTIGGLCAMCTCGLPAGHDLGQNGKGSPLTAAETAELFRPDPQLKKESGVLATVRRWWRRFGDWLNPHAPAEREYRQLMAEWRRDRD